ncbi:hypothetical protein SBA4_1720019 [Candidatus Sulfopaludibacter sp. SbA4]|nr:hypothetical protein SBA4_1720019 [Candidatus Sulfopaludibacter sp. SbA4]
MPSRSCDTAAVLDLTGDQRDEAVLWDEKRVWIRKTARSVAGNQGQAR